MPTEPEVIDLRAVEDGLARWLGSKWTGLAVRGLVLLFPIAGAAFWLVWSSVQTEAVRQVQAARAEVAAVKATLGDRAADSESFQTEVRRAVIDITKKVDELSDEVFTTRVDVAVIKRLVTELREQQMADAAPTLPPDLRPRSSAPVAAAALTAPSQPQTLR